MGTVDLEVCHAGTVEPAERIYEESYVVIEGDRGNVFAAVIHKLKIILNWSTHIFQVSFLLFCMLSHSLR